MMEIMGIRRGPRQPFLIQNYQDYERLTNFEPGKKLACQKCNGMLEVGNTIIPRGLYSGRVVYYHEDCWNALEQ